MPTDDHASRRHPGLRRGDPDAPAAAPFPRGGARALPPRACAAAAGTAAAAGLDLSTGAGRAAARLRVATRLSRRLTEAALLAACRARGLRHVATGVAAAHALAVPDDGAPAPAPTAAVPAAAGRPCPPPPPLDALAEALALVVARHAGVRDGAGHRLPAGALVSDEDGNGLAVHADLHAGDAREAAREALDLLAARGLAVLRVGGTAR